MEGLPWLFFVVVSELLNISFSPTPCFNQRNPLDCRLVNQRKIFPVLFYNQYQYKTKIYILKKRFQSRYISMKFILDLNPYSIS
jgi:hypothetical protein